MPCLSCTAAPNVYPIQCEEPNHSNRENLCKQNSPYSDGSEQSHYEQCTALIFKLIIVESKIDFP